jgi:hypothetical protein
LQKKDIKKKTSKKGIKKTIRRQFHFILEIAAFFYFERVDEAVNNKINQ